MNIPVSPQETFFMNKNLLALLCCASMTSLHAMEDVLVLHSSANLNLHDGAPQAQSHARNSRFIFDLETNASEQEKKFHDDVITAYQLQQGKVTANNPINSLTHYHVREVLPSGKVITKKYKNLSHGKDRAELDKRLEMAKLLLNSRLKRIIPCIILLVAMYQSKGLLDLVGRTLVNMEYRMLNGVAICCGNQAAEILFFVFTLAKQLLPYYVMSVLPNYLGTTFGAWRDTKNLPKEIETFEKEKGTWEFESSHNEQALLVDEKDMREYADKITAGLQKQLQDAHEVVVDINNLNIMQQALQPSVNN